MREKNNNTENGAELNKDLDSGYADEVWSEEYVKELLFDDKVPAKKHGILRHWREVMRVDFDEPLSVRDQFVIMSVLLLISVLIFSAVYFAAGMRGRGSSDEVIAADVSVPYESDEEVSQSSELTSQESVPAQSKEEQSETEQSIASPLGEIKTITVSNENIHTGKLVLVNKEVPCKTDGENVKPVTEGPSEYFDVTDYTVSLDKSVIPELEAMLEDFGKMYGKTDVMIACGYRSSDTQAELYRKEVESVGEEQAELLVAPPGYSEHQTGLAFDLDLNIDTGEGGIKYEGSSIYSWINGSCSKYGFIIRYPEGKDKITGYSYEPWHFRYVGKSAAYMKNNDLTLEEYIDKVHQTSVSDPLMIVGGNYPYYVYYVKAEQGGSTKIPLPEGYEYELSGDNYSGFIVTIHKLYKRQGAP